MSHTTSSSSSSSNYIKNIAFIGAGGQAGKFLVGELLKNKQFNVTALTRVGSTSVVPDGVKSVSVDYAKHETLVAALKGQDVVIVTLSTQAPAGEQNKIVDAAAEAGVKFFVPNTWGVDRSFTKYDKESLIGEGKAAELAYLDSKNVKWIGVACNFWYEYSLSGGLPFFGIDSVNKRARFLDDGTHSISTSTWEQTGRALAAALALPIEPVAGEKGEQASLSQFVGDYIRCYSFSLSQRQMLDAVQHVTRTTDADWTIEHRDAKEVWQEGFTALTTKGDMMGFVQALYATAWFADNENDYCKKGTAANDVLGLPKEDLLACTQKAVDMAQQNYIGTKF